MTALICILPVCVTAVIIGLIYLHASSDARKSEAHRDLLTYMAAKDRATAEAEAQSKALQLYSLQSALDVIRAQSEAQSQAQRETTLALRQAVEAMREDHRVVDTLAGLQWKALEAHYSKMALPDKKRSGSRYWEEVDWGD